MVTRVFLFWLAGRAVDGLMLVVTSAVLALASPIGTAGLGLNTVQDGLLGVFFLIVMSPYGAATAFLAALFQLLPKSVWSSGLLGVLHGGVVFVCLAWALGGGPGGLENTKGLLIPLASTLMAGASVTMTLCWRAAGRN